MQVQKSFEEVKVTLCFFFFLLSFNFFHFAVKEEKEEAGTQVKTQRKKETT